MGPLFAFGLPALEAGIKIFTNDTIARYVNLGFGIIARGIDIAQGFKDLNDEIQKMVDAGRNPNDDDWKVLFDRRAASHESIQTAPLNPT